MATIREYRKKIKSTKNIAKITKAMQMVAASKMRRSQDQAQKSRPYAEGLVNLTSLISTQADPSIHPLLLAKNEDSVKELVILVAPEKGLCGSLITNLAKSFYQSFLVNKNLEFIIVGKKARTIVEKVNGDIIAEFNTGSLQPKYEIVPAIARLAEEKFLSGDVGKVRIIFSEFVNTMTQKPTQKILLPLHLTSEEKVNPENNLNPFYLFEPSAKDITDSLLELYLEIEIYQFLLESYASEQSARMVAMKNATDNAISLTNALTLEFNKARQANITSEISDIGNSQMAVQ
ncbi:ATP synthase F1 subunit gamma [Candidatus Woesebacteria bacterium RIFCSPLOWO2_01_FULL_37_19]|uniref:ATP synthase gamma chain n=2 Tax=Candidatus Woeseibacteriota TaxID=1752722 RepID=A0A1F8BA89_9BACT|nr:MAG: ATP synthase F1 subunit gamma [Candidatus Woesebacteria bacterium RIFCSPHIGHO2_01_FULL_38_26b]OGM60964.1 MAG: ATP synthase F1 subunit gamma [Candidatus Woesebacteria bacterium RIFCSPLOWO2_01_FULL_37_19]